MKLEEILSSEPVVFRKIMEALVTSFQPLTIKEISKEINQPETFVYSIVKAYPREVINEEYDEENEVYTGRYQAGKQWDLYFK